MKVNPYLNFDGNCEEAMGFYAEATGATMGEVHRFSSMPGAELPPELQNRVMHVDITLPGGAMIMGSDTLQGMSPPRVVGNNNAISLHPDSREQADAIFAALAEGGTVGMPLEDQFWGDYFGSLTDRYGVEWMINFFAE